MMVQLFEALQDNGFRMSTVLIVEHAVCHSVFQPIDTICILVDRIYFIPQGDFKATDNRK